MPASLPSPPEVAEEATTDVGRAASKASNGSMKAGSTRSRVGSTTSRESVSTRSDQDDVSSSDDDLKTRLHSLKLDDGQRAQRGREGSWGRKLFLLMCLCLLGAGAYAYQTDQLPASITSYFTEPVVKVETYTIPGRGITPVLTLSGVIEPATRVDITPLVPGVIVELPATEGAQVQEGDLLARILDTSYRADLAEAEAALASAESRLLELENGSREEDVRKMRALLKQAEANMEMNRRTFERTQRLREQGTATTSSYDQAEGKKLVSESEVDRLRAELDLVTTGARAEVIKAARADVARAEAMVERAKFFVENTEVRAPISGTILERNAELGEVSRSDYFLTDLVVIGDLNEMIATVEVQERDVSRISVGQSCVVIPDAYPDARYLAKVTRIQPKVNRQRGVVPVTVALVQPDGRLLAEMNGRVEFYDGPAEEIPLEPESVEVPNSAVVEIDGESQVYVVEEERALLRPVVLKQAAGSDTADGDNNASVATGESVEVATGLVEGDVVVVSVPAELAENVRVTTNTLDTESGDAP